MNYRNGHAPFLFLYTPPMYELKFVFHLPYTRGGFLPSKTVGLSLFLLHSFPFSSPSVFLLLQKSTSLGIGRLFYPLVIARSKATKQSPLAVRTHNLQIHTFKMNIFFVFLQKRFICDKI